MTAPKQLVKKIVDSLPEDTSYDEILKELAFNKMIQKGLKDKVLWLLEHFKNDGLEIVSKEDLDDLKLLKASREDETIDFEEYLKNENCN